MTSTPSARCLLDGMAVPVPRCSTEPARPSHRQEMTWCRIIVHPTQFDLRTGARREAGRAAGATTAGRGCLQRRRADAARRTVRRAARALAAPKMAPQTQGPRSTATRRRGSARGSGTGICGGRCRRRPRRGRGAGRVLRGARFTADARLINSRVARPPRGAARRGAAGDACGAQIAPFCLI